MNNHCVSIVTILFLECIFNCHFFTEPIHMALDTLQSESTPTVSLVAPMVVKLAKKLEKIECATSAGKNFKDVLERRCVVANFFFLTTRLTLFDRFRFHCSLRKRFAEVFVIESPDSLLLVLASFLDPTTNKSVRELFGLDSFLNALAEYGVGLLSNFGKLPNLSRKSSKANAKSKVHRKVLNRRLGSDDETSDDEVDDEEFERYDRSVLLLQFDVLSRFVFLYRHDLQMMAELKSISVEVDEWQLSENENVDEACQRWWYQRGSNFPLCATLARILLSMPCGTPGEERMCSQATSMITPKRNRLSADTVDDLIVVIGNKYQQWAADLVSRLINPIAFAK